MSQQPNIQIESKKNIEDSDLPVPRSQGKDTLPNSLRSPDEEVFSIPSPDSGYALKLIKPFTAMWKDNHKHKLITKVVTNLVIYQASKIGRGNQTKFEGLLWIKKSISFHCFFNFINTNICMFLINFIESFFCF